MKKSLSLEHTDNEFHYHHYIEHDYVNYGFHMHEGYEIYYFLSGDVTYFIEGTAYKLNPNDLLLINDRELHRPQLNSKCIYERVVLNFNKEFLQELKFQDYDPFKCLEDRPNGIDSLIPSHEVLSNDINKIIQNIIKLNDDNISSKILRKTYTLQMLVSINNIIENSKKSESSLINKGTERVQEIIHYINDNLSSNLSLTAMEDRFYVSKYYLCHQFKEASGFTLNEYITYKRIMKARELIKSGYPITEVYSLVGFNDYSNFYKAFRKATGFSPKQYKKTTEK